MSLPPSPFSNIDDGGVPFHTPGWEDEFGRYCWIYVRGFRDAMLAARAAVNVVNPANVNVTMIKSFVAQAPKHVPIPTAYVKAAPTLDWHVVAGPQIDTAHRINLMRFDKAWLAIAALDLMCAQIAPGFDIWDFVRLCPAVFFLEGFDRAVLNAVKQKNLFELMRVHCYQDHDSVFERMAAGTSSVTHRTAARAAEYLKKNGFGDFKVSRVNGRGERSPSSLETVWHVGSNGPVPYARKTLKRLLG